MTSPITPPLHSWMRKSPAQRWHYKSLRLFAMTCHDTRWHVLTHLDTSWHVLTRFGMCQKHPKTTRHAKRAAVVAPLGLIRGAITTHVQNATRHEMTRSDTKSHESHEIKQKKSSGIHFGKWSISNRKKTGPQPKKQQTGFLRPQNLRGAATALVLRSAATAPFGSSWYIYIYRERHAIQNMVVCMYVCMYIYIYYVIRNPYFLMLTFVCM